MYIEEPCADFWQVANCVQSLLYRSDVLRRYDRDIENVVSNLYGAILDLLM